MTKTDHMMPGSAGELRTHCIRCGTCCLKGGPTLHREDAGLCTKGILKTDHLYTLRKGEIVRDIDDTLKVLEGEIIKIKGQDEGCWTCMFYNEQQKACKIYEDRPIECKALKCWDLRELKEAMASPHLQRRHLINPRNGILRIIGAHEQRCAYETLESALRELKGPDSPKAVEMILDLLRYDQYMRPLLTKKLKVPPRDMDFYFGRPLRTTIKMFGLSVKQQGDSFVLMPTESCSLT
ncbi:MAG: YkgJ family cysteine cluster protein [Thermodesulfobacteriota bacterium]|nr:YkgJ family cysteine cluster protein [Thermodesulfobacteriota bacterium]